MKQKKSRLIIGFMIIVIGLFAINYPLLSGVVSDFFSYKEIQGYKSDISAMSENELSETLETAHKYNDALSSGGSLDEFRNFSLLKPGAMLGYVEIPQINVYNTVRYSTDSEVLVQSLGLVEGSSLPVGGEGCHSVISGHTGMASKKMLTELTEVQKGDIFFLHILGQDMAYCVDNISVVEPWDNSELSIIEGSDYVTLLTCTPYGVNDHRLLVRGKRIEYDFNNQDLSDSNNTQRRYSNVELLRYGILALSAVILIGMIIFAIISRKKKKGMTKNNE
ncbi:MAG: class C sortase [Ruminococcus sp.]